LSSSLSLAASQLTFNSAGVPTSLVLNGTNRLNLNQSASGFFLRQFNGQTVTEKKLQNVVIDGNTYTVSESGGLPRFTFRIDAHTRYVSMHLTNIEGITDRSTGLVMRLNATIDLGSRWTLNNSYTINKGTKAFDHMVEFSNSSNLLTCMWKHLWRTDTDGKLGCFAIYDGYVSDAEVDATLAEMWATETEMVHPDVTPWDVGAVNARVDAYALKFGPANNTMMLIEAANPTDLYALTDFAISQNIKKIYLHTATWRGEYWPNYHSLDHINTDVFPNGLSDYAVYVDYLHDRGMIIYCHNVSLGIGENDPDYIVGTVDPRLDAWCTGTLEAAVDSSATTLLFRPDPGSSFPLYSDDHVLADILTWDHMRFGNEIVQVGAYHDTDKSVWRLTNCTRGADGTNPASHTAGVSGGGLWKAYSANYIAPYDVAKPNSLLKEMAQKYADLVNAAKLDHLHFDGTEIYRTNPICEETVIDEVYRRVNQVVDSVRVGRTGTANFELAFRRVPPWSYVAVQIPLRLDEENKGTWLASSRLEAHFSVANGILYGSRTIEVAHPVGGSGLTLTILNNHGLKDEMFGLLQDWRVLLPAFTTADFNYLKTLLSQIPSNNHYQSEDVPVLIKESGIYKIQPYRIMGQASGTDPLTYFYQERGVIARRQYITTGQALSLVNPYSAQGAGFYVHMLASNTQNLVNPKITTGSGYVQVAGTVLPGQYLYYDGSSSTAIIYSNSWNIASIPSVTLSSYTMPNGTASVSVGPSSPTLNLDVQFITKGTKYTLGANSTL
jgi:hypothetical protein